MLSTEPSVLARLVGTAEAERNKRSEILKQREEAAMGSMGDEFGSEDRPENLAFALFTTLLPSMVTSSPVFQVRSEGGYAERLEAAAISASLSQIARKQRMHEALEACAWDFLFKPYCAAFVEKPLASMSDLTKAERKTMKGRLFDDRDDEKDGEVKSPRATATPRMQVPARWPRIKRVDPNKCGFDSAGGSIAEARFTWYEVTEDRDDMERRAEEHSEDWIVDAVSGLPTKDDLDRDEVTYYVVYVPGGVLDEEEPKPTQPGTIHTFAAVAHGRTTNIAAAKADGASATELRRPFYWEGHPGGPLIFEGQYTTGVDPFFLSLLSANEDALSMLDAVSATLHDRIRNHKTVHVYDAAYEDDATRIAGATDGEFVPVAGLRDGGGVIQDVVTSAVSAAEIQDYAIVKENAQRQVALGEASQGRAQKGVSATADSIAANATRTKIQYLISRWTRFVREGMERMAWDAVHDDRVVTRLDEEGRANVLRAQLQGKIPVSPEGLDAIIEDMKQEPMIHQGGDFADAENGFDWHSLSIDIQPNSLDGAFGDQAMAREAMWNEQLAFLGQQMIAQPHIDWKRRISATSRALGFQDGDTIADKQIAQVVAQVQLAAGGGTPMLGSEAPSAAKQGATLRESSGGAQSPAGVDPGAFQMN